MYFYVCVKFSSLAKKAINSNYKEKTNQMEMKTIKYTKATAISKGIKTEKQISINSLMNIEKAMGCA